MNTAETDDPIERALLENLGTDVEAFAALYDRYFLRVYNYVRYRVPDTPTAEDLTAEIFTRALAKLDTFSPRRGAFASWLFAIARNTVNGYHRRAKLRRLLPLSAARNLPAPAPSPPEHSERKAQRERLLEALGQLSPRERDLLGLRYAAGLRHARIARLTGLSESNVAVIIHRALHKLKPLLEETP